MSTLRVRRTNRKTFRAASSVARVPTAHGKSPVALYNRALKQLQKDEKKHTRSERKERPDQLVLPTYSSISARLADFKDDQKREYYVVNKDSFPSLYNELVQNNAIQEGENFIHMLVKLPMSITRKDHKLEFPEMHDDLLVLHGVQKPVKDKTITFCLKSAYFPHGAARGLLTLSLELHNSMLSLAAASVPAELKRPAPYVRPALTFDVTAPRHLSRGHQSWFASSTGTEDATLIASGSKEVNQQVTAAELMPLGGTVSFSPAVVAPLGDWCARRFDAARGCSSDIWIPHLNHYTRVRLTPSEYQQQILNGEECALMPSMTGIFGVMYNPISPLLKANKDVVVLGDARPLWRDDLPDDVKLCEDVRFTHAFFVALHYWMGVNGRVMELTHWDPAAPRYLFVVDPEDLSEVVSSGTEASPAISIAQSAVGCSLRSFLLKVAAAVMPDCGVAARLYNIHKNLVKFFCGRRFVGMRHDVSVRDQYKTAVSASIREFASMGRAAVQQLAKGATSTFSKSHVPRAGHEEKIGIEYVKSTPSVSLYHRVVRIEGNVFHTVPFFFAHAHFSPKRAPIAMASDAGESAARIYWWTVLRYMGLSEFTKLRKAVPELNTAAGQEPLELMIKGIRARYLCFRTDGSGVLNLAYPSLIHGQHAAFLGTKTSVSTAASASAAASAAPAARKRKPKQTKPTQSPPRKRGRKPTTLQVTEAVDEAKEDVTYVPLEPSTGRIQPGPWQEFLPKSAHPSTFGPHMVTGRMLWRFMQLQPNKQLVSTYLEGLRACVQSIHASKLDYVYTYFECHRRFGRESLALVGMLLLLRLKCAQLMYSTELPVAVEEFQQAMHRVSTEWDNDMMQWRMAARSAMQTVRMEQNSAEDRRVIMQVRVAYSAQFPTFALHPKLTAAHDAFLKHTLTPQLLREFVMGNPQLKLWPVYRDTGKQLEQAILTKLCTGICRSVNDKRVIGSCYDADMFALATHPEFLELPDSKQSGVAMLQRILDTWVVHVQQPIMSYAAHACNPLYGPVMSNGCQWVTGVKDNVRQKVQQDESAWSSALSKLANAAADRLNTRSVLTSLFRQKNRKIEYKQESAAAALLLLVACENHIAEAERSDSSDTKVPLWKEIASSIHADRQSILDALPAFFKEVPAPPPPASSPALAAPSPQPPVVGERTWMRFLEYLASANLFSTALVDKCIVLIFESEHKQHVLDSPLSAIGCYLAVIVWNNIMSAANIMQFVRTLSEQPKHRHYAIVDAFNCASAAQMK